MIRSKENFTSISQEAPVDIEMGTWRISVDGTPLFTSGAKTCIVFTAYNSETGHALMGHFTDLMDQKSSGYDRDKFDEAVDALETLGNPEKTEVWLGGGTPYIENGIDTMKPDREYAEQTLLGYQLDSAINNDGLLSVEWSHPGQAVDVAFDPRLGILAVLQTD